MNRKDILLVLGLLLGLLLLTAGDLFADEKGIPASADTKYQGYEPDKKLYQRKLGVWYYRVSIKEIDWDRRHQARLSIMGINFMTWGAIILAIGLAASMTFHQPLYDTIASCLSATGGILIGIGMLYMKMTEVWHWIGWALGISLIIAVIWWLRDKGWIKTVKDSPQGKIFGKHDKPAVATPGCDNDTHCKHDVPLDTPCHKCSIEIAK